ncbi:MAG TPA: hypothetical protein VFE51_02285 [Verrucomicrobiae bacterium]|nr:hypothetical protein [Verrucomicrobiae bacterium]
MPTFSSPDIFKEHKQYVPLLKKALLGVKADSPKKFVYFKQYPFGQKKLPLVLVDFDPACLAALAKAGQKPTDEGLVSLTSQDELNFEPKKGSLKRAALKKYFTTMGGGIKPVFVPPGETDDESEAPEIEGQESPPGGTIASQPDAAKAGREEMARFTARLKAMQPDLLKAIAGAGPAARELKAKLAEAGALAKKGDVVSAGKLLDAVEALMRKAPAAGLDAALEQWTTARGKVINDLKALEKAIRDMKDPEGDEAIILVKAIQANLTSRPETAKAVKELERYIATDEIITEAEEPNGFGLKIAIRGPLLPALAALRSALPAG